MTRVFVLTLAIVGLATTGHAQVIIEDAYAWDGSELFVDLRGGLPHGGFGLEYAQPIAGGRVVMDQYGLLHAIRTVEAAPRALAAQPRRSETMSPTRGSRTSPTVSRAAARSRLQLPTGSLAWAGVRAVVLYSPGVRYEAYGNGYLRGAYGVVDHSRMYHGMALDY